MLSANTTTQKHRKQPEAAQSLGAEKCSQNQAIPVAGHTTQGMPGDALPGTQNNMTRTAAAAQPETTTTNYAKHGHTALL
jgi:hypothetical protein